VPVTAHGANISYREPFQTGRSRLRGAENLHNMHTDLRLCAFLASSGRFEISWREKRWLLRRSRAPSRPKTKRMAKLSGLTVALHPCVGKRMVKLCGGRCTGRSADSSTAVTWRAVVAWLPCLCPWCLPVPPCPWWWCVCGVPACACPAARGVATGGGALPTMAQGQQSIPDGWTVGCPSLPALSP